MSVAAQPLLLSGGNPQIAKGYGPEVVESYLSAMPGWKQRVGREIDSIITQTLPGVAKAVKYNSPLYGLGDGTYFIGFHCLTKYVKVSFMRGAELSPQPPGPSKQASVRYLDIYEADVIDEAQFADWVTQASLLPGDKL
jgi:hypothetical protein